MTVEYFNNHVQCYDDVALIYLKGQTHYQFGDNKDEAKQKLLTDLQKDKLIEKL